MRQRHFLGHIELGNDAIISDPCYDTDVWCMMTLRNLRFGKWFVESYQADDSWDGHILLLTAEKYKLGVVPKQRIGFGGIDSGQAGVYNSSEYHNNHFIPVYKHNGITNPLETDDWYGYACHISNGGVPAKIVGNGVTSESGYGDGTYDILIDRNTKGEVIRIALVF